MQVVLGALLRQIEYHDVSEVGGKGSSAYTEVVGFDGISTRKICSQNLTM